MRFRAFRSAVAALLLIGAVPAIAQHRPGDCGYYRNSDGNLIPRPCGDARKQPPPPGATAQCRDGTYSFSQHRSGTCSGHGGVQSWR